VEVIELSEGLKIPRHTTGQSANHGEKIASGFRSALIGFRPELKPKGRVFVDAPMAITDSRGAIPMKSGDTEH